MNHFAQFYRQMSAAYQAGQYEKVVEIGDFVARTLPIDAVDRFVFHEAMAASLLLSGRWQEACHHFERAMRVESGAAELEKQRLFCSDFLVWLHFWPGVSDEALFAMHCLYGSLFRSIVPYTHIRSKKQGLRKLRIGYLSPDLYEHVVTNFSVQLYAAYDKRRFEVYLYHLGDIANEVTEWLQGMVDGFRHLPTQSAQEIAAQIYADDIDILVDLSGHTNKGCTLQVMAYKPAPVQVSGIGYFNTTGLAAVDYFLTDDYCDPPGNEKFFTEKLWRLSHSHFCFTPSEDVLHCRSQWQRHESVVFGSFSNFFKLNDELLTLWLRIIRQVPGSRLLLKNVRPELREVEKMALRMQKLGYQEAEFVLRPGTKYYMDEYFDMDIALDPYPYPGGGTTCEALYMGIPVISCYGTRHGSRFGYSLLKNIGLEELTANTAEEYVERAVMLARSPELLTELHHNLRAIMLASPVMDAKNYVEEIQAGYEQMYQEWLRN